MSNENQEVKAEVINTTPAVVNTNTKELKKVLKGGNIVMSLVKHYLKLETGEVLRAFYMGKTLYTDENEETRKAILLMDENKKTYVSPHSVLVNALTDLAVGTAVEITNLGKLNGKKYYSFDVTLLEVE